MALTQISTGGIKDDAVTDAKLPANSVGNSEMKDDAVGVAELSASGTASSSTFLRGDNSWQTVSSVGGATGVDFNDNVKARFGTGNDLEIYHNGTNSKLTNSTGTLYLEGTTEIWNSSGSEAIAKFTTDGAVSLYHNNELKLATTSAGLEVMDNSATSTQILIKNSDGNSGYVYGSSDNSIGFLDGQGHWTVKGVKDGGVELYYDNVKKFETANAGIIVAGYVNAQGDNGYAYICNDDLKSSWGTGLDLEIYHNGSDSYIKNATGDLVFQHGTENLLVLRDDQGVELYYDNSKKFETTTSGATLTGELVTTGDIDPSADGGANLGSADKSWYNIFVNNDIHLADNGQAIFGDGSDLSISSNGTDGFIKQPSGAVWTESPAWVITSANGGETMARFTEDGSCDLYYDNAKVFQTLSYGAKINRPSGGATDLEVIACEGQEANILLAADDGDDDPDKWRLRASIYGSGHYQWYNGSGWTDAIKAVNAGTTELYHNGNKKLETISTGVNVTGGIRLGGNNADNEMDDYEEGTYNPTWGGITNYASGYNIWSYTKIGRLVNILGTLRLKTTTNDGTDVSFSLPFTPAAQTNAGNTGKISIGPVMHNNVETGSNGLVTYAYGGNAYGYFYNNVEDSSWWILESQHLSLDDTIYVNFTYIT